MNIQFVRLDEQVCNILNQMAQEQKRTVSELVNEILKIQLTSQGVIIPGAANAG